MSSAPSGQSRRRTLFGAAVALVLVAAAMIVSVRQRREAVVETRAMMSTFITLTVVDADKAAARAALAAGFERLEQLERILSAHAPDSELAAVNAAAGGEAVAVSEELFRAIETGVLWHGRTGGAFDITLKPLLDLWRACAVEKRLPTEEEIAQARALVGADRIELDAAARTVRLPVPGMRIDLGGLGKGFSVDETLRALQAREMDGALIANSGDIYAFGVRPDKLPWRVGVQNPRDPNNPQALLTVVELSDKAVSTSGNYQRFVEIEGHRYSHIVDPRTGRTAEDVPSVTVIAPDATTSDILGTALSVLGVREGLALVERMPEVEAMFVRFDADGAPIITRSSGFRRYEAGSVE